MPSKNMPCSLTRIPWIPDGSWRSEGQRVLVAVFTAFLFLRSTAGSYWDVNNRFYLHWRTLDTLGVFGAILFMGLAFWVAWHALARLGRFGRWTANAAFAVILLQYARVNLAESLLNAGMLAPWGVWMLRLAHLVLLAGFFVARRHVVAGLRNGCLLFSPILLVYAWTLLNGMSYEQVARNRHAHSEWPPRPAAAGRVAAGRGIMLVIFDEWSYARTFDEDGRVRPEFPELARAAANAIVFTRAKAPGMLTMESVPQILTGKHGGAGIASDGLMWFQAGAEKHPFATYDNLFGDFRQRGYQTAIVGCYLPYADLLGDDADICVSYDLYRVMGPSPFALAANAIAENLRIRLGFIHEAFAWPFYLAQHRYHVRMAETIHAKTLDLARTPESRFVMIHQSVPHMPFIFDRDGARPNLHRRPALNLEDYYGNLRYTDRLIGEIFDAVEAQEDRRQLLVLTSDHGFRYDPMWKGLSDEQEREKRRHVPMLVIPPHRRGSMTIDVPFDLTNLGSVLTEWADSGELPDEWQGAKDAP